MKRRVSSEECAEGFFDLADGNEFDVELLAVEGRVVVFRDDDMLESQLLGLADALFDAGDRANFATESDLASHAPAFVDGRIDIARQY